VSGPAEYDDVIDVVDLSAVIVTVCAKRWTRRPPRHY